MANHGMIKGSAVAMAMVLLGSALGAVSRQVAERMGYVLANPGDYLRFLPYNLVALALSTGLAIIASAGLFGMAFAEADGREPDLLDFSAAAFRAPWRWVPPAVTVTVASQVIFVPIVVGFQSSWAAMAAVLAAQFLTGPFLILLIPSMVHDNLSFRAAFRRSLSLGRQSYGTFLIAGASAYIAGMWGMFLLVVGYLWTQPNYQRRIVRLFRSVGEP